VLIAEGMEPSSGEAIPLAEAEPEDEVGLGSDTIARAPPTPPLDFKLSVKLGCAFGVRFRRFFPEDLGFEETIGPFFELLWTDDLSRSAEPTDPEILLLNLSSFSILARLTMLIWQGVGMRHEWLLSQSTLILGESG